MPTLLPAGCSVIDTAHRKSFIQARHYPCYCCGGHVPSASENTRKLKSCRCRGKLAGVRQHHGMAVVLHSLNDSSSLRKYDQTNIKQCIQDLQHLSPRWTPQKKTTQMRRVLDKEAVYDPSSIAQEQLSILQAGSLIQSKEDNGHRFLSVGGQHCDNRTFMTKDQQVYKLEERQAGLHEGVQKQLEIYVNAVKAAMSMPFGSKPSEASWQLPDYFSKRTRALKQFALASCTHDKEQRQIAYEVMHSLGMCKTPTAALHVLIGMGVFPFHVNLDLLRSGLKVEFSDVILAAANVLKFKACPDAEMKNRVDLRSLKVYCIDPDNPEEIDDGLSATQLPDGRVKLWIHISDPTSWISPESCLEKEARKRGTSVYLPTQTLPMFPTELVTSCLSFRQGVECFALSVSIILKDDGSIAESMIVISAIQPTYMLSYDQASELIFMKLEEENELSLLSYAATLRRQWRRSQGAKDLSYPPKVKVLNAESLDPLINIEVLDSTNPAVELVSEMMILCGEAVSMFGYKNSLVLPYRGQLLSNLHFRSANSKQHYPSKDVSRRQNMGPVDVNLRRPLAHSFLGLVSYVQFTSPIRRYSDFLTHYQVKAALRGDKFLFKHSYLEAAFGWANKMVREAKKLEYTANRYWILEYLLRHPKDKLLKACILRFMKDREACVLLKEIGFEAVVTVFSKADVGSEIKVTVKDAQPRKGILLLMEVF